MIQVFNTIKHVIYHFRKAKRKSCFAFLVIMLAAGCFCGCTPVQPIPSPANTPTTVFHEPVSTLEITILKIGKADAIVFTTPSCTVLLDVGEAEDGKEIAAYLHKRQISQIDALTITHFDKDHVGGIETILHDFYVKRVFQPDYIKDSKPYHQYVSALDENGITPTSITQTTTFTIDGISFTIEPPLHPDLEQDGDNDLSLIVSVQHGDNRLLFAADAEEKRTEELLTAKNLKHAFLKMPHHGAYHANTEALLDAVCPTCAVITCSDNNPPDDRTLQALLDRGIQTVLTSDGDIHCVSDGKTLSVFQ